MTIVHPPSLERDTNAIEHLDFAPSCEFRRACDAATAAYVAWFAVRPCGCGRPGRSLTFCEACWVRAMTDYLYCPHCGDAPQRVSDYLLRVERI